MQIVIEMDEGIFEGIIEGGGDIPRNIVRSYQATIADAIKHGTVVPEQHGRLIDSDWLEKELERLANIEWNKGVGVDKGLNFAIDVADYAPTIIKASEVSE